MLAATHRRIKEKERGDSACKQSATHKHIKEEVGVT
jgi:hypothetical protein